MADVHPDKWVGLGFVSTIENANPDVMASIDGITQVAAQIIWGLDAQKPGIMEGYLDDLVANGLEAVGWGWCDAETNSGARAEGLNHARLCVDLELVKYVANMEEPYDAHGDQGSIKYHRPDIYLEAFQSVAPYVELGMTCTPRWASNHAAVRAAGAVLMPQAFPLENGHSIASCVEFANSWGWTNDRIRPLVQVYKTNGKVPDSLLFLTDSETYGVGVIPYILEQALRDPGRTLLDQLEPAISRMPLPPPKPPTPEDPMEKIGSQHGIAGFMKWIRAQPDCPPRGPGYDPNRIDTWPWPDKVERTLNILVSDHDEAAG